MSIVRRRELLVGLPEVNVLEVVDTEAGLRVTIETRGARPTTAVEANTPLMASSRHAALAPDRD